MKLTNDTQTLNQIAPLIQYSFRKNYDLTRDANFLSRYYHSENYGEYNENTLSSYVMVNKFESKIFSSKVKMAGIGYVCSYPEVRGHGCISKIMTEILNDLYNSGVVLSNLAPWSETFYRQYGYENAIYQKTLTFGASSLQYFKPTQTGKIIRGTLKDKQIQNLVKQLYQKQINSGFERNTVIRTAWWWNRFTTYYPNRQVAVYINQENEPGGYLFYNLKNHLFSADELWFANQEAAINLLAFMGSHVSSCDKFKIIMPSESFIEELFPNQEGLTAATQPYMMSRIVNFAAIISCIKILSDNPVVIEVTDDKYCPENNGSWSLVPETDGTLCKKVTAKPDYSGTVTDWTRVLVGRLTVDEAIRLGLIRKLTNKPFAIEKGTVSFYDYF